jgi:hypothetical protein
VKNYQNLLVLKSSKDSSRIGTRGVRYGIVPTCLDANILNHIFQLVNEEGLPIIDITEPVDDKPSQTPEPLPTSIIEEPFAPSSSLSPSSRARRNDQVKRILDYLEEEERQEELTEKQRELQERSDMLQKLRSQEAEKKANIKAAKELQKKMGRALLQNIGKERRRSNRNRKRSVYKTKR